MGKLPSQPEYIQKESCQAITLRSGKEVEKDLGKKKRLVDDDEGVGIEEVDIRSKNDEKCEKKSSKGRTLIGVTDMDENLFENDTQEEVLGVWTFVIGSGEKYSSEKKLEQYFDIDAKEKDSIYMMKKENKLFFHHIN